MLKRYLFLLAIFSATAPLAAQEPLEGRFVATKDCEAYQSKNNRTNPGGIRVVENKAYEVLGINARGGEWYQVTVAGAPVTEARWVHASCGQHVSSSAPLPAPTNAPEAAPPASSHREATNLLLSLTWQPAYCETRSSRTECLQLNSGLLPQAASRLSLHGLWPQPEGAYYCGVPAKVINLDKAKRWDQLPAPTLDADTKKRLAVAMPGTASFLERHEWIKHGTCFSDPRDSDAYFDDALRILAAINDSEVGRFLASNIGAKISTADLRAAFDRAFGHGAGDRIQVTCSSDQGDELIDGLKVALFGEITETANVGELIHAAARLSPGCPRGILDPFGLQ